MLGVWLGFQYASGKVSNTLNYPTFSQKEIGQILHNSNSNVRISTGELSSLLWEGANPVIQKATVRSVTRHAGCLQVF